MRPQPVNAESPTGQEARAGNEAQVNHLWASGIGYYNDEEEPRGTLDAMIACLRRARRKGTLPVELRAADARAACPRWAASWGTFLPKHCRGNPGHDSVHFVRLTRGLYRFIDDAR